MATAVAALAVSVRLKGELAAEEEDEEDDAARVVVLRRLCRATTLAEPLRRAVLANILTGDCCQSTEDVALAIK